MQAFLQSVGERIGDPTTAALGGLLTGLIFGAFAQQSRFCLRSACIEFWHFQPGRKFAIWLVAFSSALILTQVQMLAGTLDPGSIRQLATTGSLSGAIIGGALFGTGMVLARGCASRLLVLSATGNLRALVAGLILTVFAQASLTGILSPLRARLSAIWLIGAEERDLATMLPHAFPLMAGIVIILAGLLLAWRTKTRPWLIVAASLTGSAVALGWWLTSWHASWTFDLVAVKSVSFTGPSADTLMALITQPAVPLTFDTGLVPGVFAGSFLAAMLTREFKWQTFDAGTGMVRYLAGAVLMGFGGMLAGGCAVGAGVTGGSVMALTAWIALLFMWLSAGLADALLDRRADSAAPLARLTQIKDAPATAE
ncbi:MAG: YeeE/YedE family protein [Rhizobiaceae bacterium]